MAAQELQDRLEEQRNLQRRDKNVADYGTVRFDEVEIG
jgi:hypothetical protein